MLDVLDYVDGSGFIDEDVAIRLSPTIMCSFGEFSDLVQSLSDSIVVA